MKKLIFGLDDFAEMLWDGKPLTIERIAKIAQAKHDAWLKELMDGAKVVYGQLPVNDFYWTGRKQWHDTHQGLLINVKEIEQKCEKHSPMNVSNGDGYNTRNICRYCGIELEIQWVAK